MRMFWSNLCDIFLKYALLQAVCCGFRVAYISQANLNLQTCR